MTIRHLRIFAAVVDCGTMHAAAQKLYLSQPTITQAVKEETMKKMRVFGSAGRG